MKIRLVGSADLVRAWSAELQKAYGITGREYPSRYNEAEIRAYFDLDDRQAAAIVRMPEPEPDSRAAAPGSGAAVPLVRPTPTARRPRRS